MSVDPKRVESLFHRALELPPAEHADFLDSECAGDAILRERVEALLAAHAELETDLTPGALGLGPPGTGAGEAARPAGDDIPRPSTGTVLAGKYKLVEAIGEGGMGSVWMAQQTEPVKRIVAVKLIKAGMDSRAVLVRFEAERQALALMDHPNIARVLDAGATPDGRPFFVMELVKGVPITKYCDDHKLTPRERLELFVPVCQAIQHAHQKGVIHRDIKPSNVLVALYDDRPVPKVIDFGVAKAAGQTLTEKTLATGFGAVVGTPEYMSPEQASFNNLDIDTRSDVYALGVLLYELLAGSPPFSKKELEKVGLLEIFRVIREQEPPKPSTKLSTADALPTLSANRGTEPRRLKALLRGELDWIVMKALEKDRARRYESANGFAADVQRYLAGEPVLAVPPSAGYRMRKFLRKNRAAVLTGVAFAGLLVAGAVTSVAFAIRANWHADQASRNESRANEAKGESDRNAALATANEKLAKAETERVRGMLFTANFGRIGDALRDQRIGRVRQLLAETKPGPKETDLRGFEWFYVDRLVNSHKDVATLHDWAGGMEAHITYPSLSRDGRWAAMVNPTGAPDDPNIDPRDVFASTTNDHELRLWDLSTGQVVFTLKRRTPDGYMAHQPIVSPGLIAWGVKRTITIYNPVTRKEERSITVEGHVSFLRFDLAGTRLVAVTLVPDPKGATKVPYRPLLRQVEIWDVVKNERLHLIASEEEWSPTEMAIAPDGSRIAVEYSRPEDTRSLPNSPPRRPTIIHRIAVWDLGSGKKTFEVTANSPSLPAGGFSHDSRLLAVTHGKTVTLYDAATGQPRRALEPTDAEVSAVAHSQDGRTLAVGDAAAGITIFDVESGEPIDQLFGHEQAITLLAFRGDHTLVSVCQAGKLKEWSLGQWRQVLFPNQGPARGMLAANSTGRYAMTAQPTSTRPGEFGFSEAVLWDMSSGQPRELSRKPLVVSGSSHPVLMPMARFSPDGRRVLVTFFEWASWRQLHWTFPRHAGLLLPTPVDWFGGLSRASLGWAQQTPRRLRTVVWDVPSGEIALDLPHTSMVMEGKFSPDGRYLLMPPQQAPDRKWTEPEWSVWDLSARPARRVPLEAAPSIAVGPNETLNHTHAFGPGPHLTAVVRRGRVFPDQASVTAETVLIRWNLETGRLVFARPIPDAPKYHFENTLSFSPDGTRVVAVPSDGSWVRVPDAELRLWDIRPDGETVRRMTEGGDWLTGRNEGSTNLLPQLRVDFTPDGKKLLAVAENQTRVWNLDAPDEPIILRGTRGWPLRAALSDDNRRLVLVSDTATFGTKPRLELKVWDLVGKQELLSLPLPLRYRPDDGRDWVQSFDGKQLRLFVKSQRGGEFVTLHGSPRESER